MDFELTEEHRMVQEMTRSFAEREIKPVASRMDHDGIYPAELVKELGRIGLMGVFAPQEHGGAGLDFVSYIIALEEISKVWASLGTIMSVNNSLVCGPLLRYGSEAQIKRYLPLVAGGEWTGCYALTEPTSGSDDLIWGRERRLCRSGPQPRREFRQGQRRTRRRAVFQCRRVPRANRCRGVFDVPYGNDPDGADRVSALGGNRRPGGWPL